MTKKRNSSKKKGYYAVARGYQVGVYRTWEETEKQVLGYSENLHQGYIYYSGAKKFMTKAGIHSFKVFENGKEYDNEIYEKLLMEEKTKSTLDTSGENGEAQEDEETQAKTQGETSVKELYEEKSTKPRHEHEETERALSTPIKLPSKSTPAATTTPKQTFLLKAESVKQRWSDNWTENFTSINNALVNLEASQTELIKVLQTNNERHSTENKEMRDTIKLQAEKINNLRDTVKQQTEKINNLTLQSNLLQTELNEMKKIVKENAERIEKKELDETHSNSHQLSQNHTNSMITDDFPKNKTYADMVKTTNTESQALQGTSTSMWKSTGKVTSQKHSLILSDSIFSRMHETRTKSMLVEQQYVRGGVEAMIKAIQECDKTDFDSVVLHTGTNDLKYFADGTMTPGIAYDKLASTAKKKFTKASIIMSSILPRQDKSYYEINNVNRSIEKVCEKQKLKFQNNDPVVCYNSGKVNKRMFHDNVHLNDRHGLPRLLLHTKHSLGVHRSGIPPFHEDNDCNTANGQNIPVIIQTRRDVKPVNHTQDTYRRQTYGDSGHLLSPKSHHQHRNWGKTNVSWGYIRRREPQLYIHGRQPRHDRDERHWPYSRQQIFSGTHFDTRSWD
ncbi:uncharacterized protein LOC106179332 [Lingula anatina]|uniref:Uncharacterized protein LOC106179332 n=1 Tax=Lingula anatina TaxID=7574 RepID=A0A1S3K6Y7_LINAN|nr:uncharacterized protein LOC106179332 [Lingula anatina]|eukprot:XP_013418390.1 uncharacterized protein LOC106179332 [Lingula anatina]